MAQDRENKEEILRNKANAAGAAEAEAEAKASEEAENKAAGADAGAAESDAEAGSEGEEQTGAKADAAEGQEKGADESESAGKPDEQGAAEGETQEAAEEDEDLKTRYMRLMADFQNYKKRIEKEKNDVYAYANEQIMMKLLEVMDNFARALDLECGDKGYADGMAMIYKQLTDALTSSGLEEIKAEGEDFDPNFHNAVMMEDKEGVESGKVTEELQKGYTLKGKVIRPSMVKVSN